MSLKKNKKILILGSGAIKIGQAGEFDYSGSQAIKALKEEGIKTVLINPNIATIQTSEDLADKIYFLPINFVFLEKIIKKEKIDSIILGFGGQTALNAGLELEKKGILKKYKIDVLGSSLDSIIITEDRKLFSEKLDEINLKTPISRAVNSSKEALKVAEEIKYPVMCRIAYALGGLGSGVARNKKELEILTQKAFAYADQVLIEEYLEGWKELEYEVVRDKFDNCLVVCSMENFDPMGIHTGESIVVAPIQTLNSKENFKLRSIAIKAIKHLGIVGECNIQYAFNPESEDYRIIEVNARLSRSSALASKATGYPLAFIAAKLALGKNLGELINSVTEKTSAFFEPSLDYLVLKYPRWDLEKFRMVSKQLGSEMKSVGEVMAIGRKFEEVLQKSIRMLDIGANGLVCNNDGFYIKNIKEELKNPTDNRIFAIAQALESDYSVDEIYKLSKINKWFLYKLENIIKIKKELESYKEIKHLPVDILAKAKEFGFSDLQLARIFKTSFKKIRSFRKRKNILPVVKKIDTLAGEFPAQTNYLYITYNGKKHDLEFREKKQIIVLGGGSYRIGSSVEFDWCCVSAIKAIKKEKFPTIMINYNPETVSTDYDICDKLYFEELSLERVLDICDLENIFGVVVYTGGQIPNNLALSLYENNIKILGTHPNNIDRAESRHKFSQLLNDLKIDQPEWAELTDLESAKLFSKKVGYPVLMRPSYVLSGAAMSVALNEKELSLYLKKASEVNKKHPVVISKFIDGAKEFDVDGVAQNGELKAYAVSEHIENAGVHSGDATMVLPPQKIYLSTLRQIKIIVSKIVKALDITGPFNMQFLAKDSAMKVIECNVRASRSFPFVSKILKLNFIEIAIKSILGKKLKKLSGSHFDLDYLGVKAPEFSFTRLKGSDPIQGVEMTSTGEVACLGDDLNEAFLKSLLSVGYVIPEKNILISSGPLESKVKLFKSIKMLVEMDYNILATEGTAKFLKKNNLKVKVLSREENEKENIFNYLKNGKIDLVINIPKSNNKKELDNDYLLRRMAIDSNISLITNLQVAKRFIKAIYNKKIDDLDVKSWDEYI